MTFLIGFLSPRRRVIAHMGAGTQDTGGVNAASQLNDDLLWAVVSGAHPWRDRAGGTDGQAEGAAALATDAAGFAALRSPGWGGARWYWPAPTIDTLEWTVGVRLRMEATAGDQPAGDHAKILAIPFHELPDWFPPGGWHLWLGPMSVGAPTAGMRVGYAIDASTLVSCATAGDFVLLDGEEHTYVARVRDEGANGAVDWWRDGTLVTTLSFNAAHTTPNLGAAPYLIALARHRIEPDEGTKATMPAAAIWGKALSDAQIGLFSSNPWDLAEISTGPSVPPTLRAWDNYVTADIDQMTPVAVLSNDSGTGLTVTDVTQPQGVEAGTTVAVASGGAGVEITVAPDEEAESFDFTYTVEDADEETDTATVHVGVFKPPPLGVDDSYSLAAGGTHVVSPLDNDNAPEGSTIESVTQPSGVESGTSVAIAANDTDLEITIAENETGSFSFTYTADGPAVSGWTNTIVVTVAASGGLEPGENVNLPFFGRYYGNACYHPCTNVGNTSARTTLAWFFWGDRNAVVDGFTMHWRHGPGYSQGDGGTYTIRIVEADPETRAPTSPRVVIAQLTNYSPASFHGFSATSDGMKHFELDFTQTGQITAKQAYCVEIINTHSNPSSNYLSVNFDLRAAYFNNDGPNEHAMPPEFWNPARIVIGGQERAWWPWPGQWRPASNAFSWRRIGHQIFNLRYADGIYSFGSAGLGGGSAYEFGVSGNTQIRDRFRVTRASRVIDRLYIPVYRKTGTSGNFVVTLEQGPSSDTSGNGTVLEELSVPVSSLYSVGSSLNVTESSAGADDHDKVPWHEFPLSQPRTLQLGTIYNIRLRSTGNSVFLRERAGPELQGTSPKASSWAEHEQIRKLSWLEGEDSRGRQETSNGGSSWTGFASRRFGWLMRCVIE